LTFGYRVPLLGNGFLFVGGSFGVCMHHHFTVAASVFRGKRWIVTSSRTAGTNRAADLTGGAVFIALAQISWTVGVQ